MNTTSRACYLCLTLFFGISTTALGQSWTGSGDGLDWHDADNWDSAAAPTTENDYPSIYGDFVGNSFNVEINQALEIGQIYTGDATLTINAKTGTGATENQAIYTDSDSTINMNADIHGVELAGDRSVLNMNSGTLTGVLGISGTSSQFNRTGGSLQLNSLNLSASAAMVTLESGDSVSGSTNASNGSTLTLNDGSVNTVSLTDSTFNWNGGGVGADVSLFGDSAFNRNGSGSLALTSLQIFDESDFELRAGDSSSSTIGDGSGTLTINGATLTNYIDFANGATIDFNSGSISGETYISGGIFNLNGGSLSGSVYLDDSFDENNTPAQFNRNGSATLNLDNLRLAGGTTMMIGDDDSVSGSISVTENSTLYIEGASISTLNVSDGGTAEINRIEAQSTLSINGTGTVNMIDGIFNDGLSVNDGTLNMSQGIVTGNVSIIGNDSVVNRASGETTAFIVDHLYVSDASFDLLRQDEVESLAIDSNGIVNATIEYPDSVADELKSPITLGTLFGIEDGSELNIIQSAGEMVGVFLDDASFNPGVVEGKINLFFDSELGLMDELDYAFAVSGDQTTALQSLIDAGQITISGNPQPVGVFYDDATNRTSIGYFVAVPEPSSVVLLSSLATVLLLRRRRD